MEKERIAELRKAYAGGCRTDAIGEEVFDALEAAQTELAALRGQRQASEVAFGEWFEAHFADWLRAMRGGFRHDDIRHFRDSLLTAWSAALRGQVGGVVPEIDPAIDRQISEYFSAISSQGSMELVSSSRVAGEDCVAVSADLLILVDKALESCRYTPQHVLREAIQSALSAPPTTPS